MFGIMFWNRAEEDKIIRIGRKFRDFYLESVCSSHQNLYSRDLFIYFYWKFDSSLNWLPRITRNPDNLSDLFDPWYEIFIRVVTFDRHFFREISVGARICETIVRNVRFIERFDWTLDGSRVEKEKGKGKEEKAKSWKVVCHGGTEACL